MYKFTETRTHFVKIGSRWKVVDSKTQDVTKEQHNNATAPETVRFFRNLGGYERVERAYTYAGYIPVKVTSISPDRRERTIREYKVEKY